MGIIEIIKSNCKDCYKCIKHCPVNAISYSDNRVCIDFDKCILDGTCVNVCPQKAKKVKTSLPELKEALKNGEKVIASIAPSFYAYYDFDKTGCILSFLKSQGIFRVEQTSQFAKINAIKHYEYMKITKLPVISTACPVIVKLIENFYPDLINLLAPVDSPMVLHAKEIKENYPDSKVVFIGPCLAKKNEAEENGIEYALSFNELEEWMNDENFSFDKVTPEFFNDDYIYETSTYPLEGSLLTLCGADKELSKDEMISLSGLEEIMEFLKYLRGKSNVQYKMIEMLACKNGCINGPLKPSSYCEANYFEIEEKFNKEINMFEKKDQKILNINKYPLSRRFANHYEEEVMPTEEQIRATLRSMEKYTKEDEINCGACGYKSCRDKAIAVIQGKAEKEMCIPYMKNRAEKFSRILLESNPNGVIILDDNLKITGVNDALLEMADKKADELINQNISVLFDDLEPFQNVLKNKKHVYEAIRAFNNKKVKKIIFSIKDLGITIVFLVDITEADVHKQALEKVKMETLEKAQAVLDKQMKVTHDVAVLLGESTAETEMLLGKLINLIKQ
ncbi:MAG TPA: 4Fe-4S binding protein [Candidatus Adamsella sp.]|nr:4Fe-4S binding protein [Candidatus Adamsella sp.]